jgi:hypothetical protein
LNILDLKFPKAKHPCELINTYDEPKKCDYNKIQTAATEGNIFVNDATVKSITVRNQ